MNTFPFVYYCDLEILVIKIYAAKQIDLKMIHTVEKHDTSLPVINLFLCDRDSCSFANLNTYREKAMQSGYYVGHHFGEPVFLRILSENYILLHCEDPGKIIWCYVIKAVLTFAAHKRGMLHIKGSSFEYKGRAFLVLGRGGSGKTELVREMCRQGARLMGNTHTIIDGNRVIGVKSNIRIRENGKEYYLDINRQNEMPLYFGWANIGALLWVQYRIDGKNIIKKLDNHISYHNMRWFSEAVGNWELKEDIADSVNSDPILFAKYMKQVDNMVEELSVKHSTYFLNLDIKSDEGKNKLIEFLDKI